MKKGKIISFQNRAIIMRRTLILPQRHVGRFMRVAQVHNIAVTGFGESNAKRYDRSRPEYPPSAIEEVFKIINSSTSAATTEPLKICELGSGTGKFTRSFLRHALNNSVKGNGEGFTHKVDYLATDPSPSFLNVLASSLDANNQGDKVKIRTQEGTGDSIPGSASNSLSAILIAQAFHWTATLGTIKEAHRTLKNGAPFIMIWNYFDTSIPWIHSIEYDIVDPQYKILEKNMNGKQIPRFITQEWEKIWQTDDAARMFSLPLIKWNYQHSQMLTMDDIVDRVLSVSVISSLPPTDQAQVADKVRHLLSTHKDTRSLKLYPLTYKTLIASVNKKA